MDDTLFTATEAVEDDLNTVFFILKAPRRRLTIRFIHRNGRCRLRELAKELTAIQMNTTPERVSNEEYRNVYNSLSQTHLPQLADANVITYNSDRQIVAPAVNIDVVYVMYRLAQLHAAQQLHQQQSPID
ncbi:DUF7344 domain-containing protein [Halosegnis longus]|uniref:DUF7344 domain-containing protein n=1 Tax=Halosegnis longus TaxID=2216012 RepID=UPI0009AC54CB|nr:hypothetical protein [Salella cibi]